MWKSLHEFPNSAVQGHPVSYNGGQFPRRHGKKADFISCSIDNMIHKLVNKFYTNNNEKIATRKKTEHVMHNF